MTSTNNEPISLDMKETKRICYLAILELMQALDSSGDFLIDIPEGERGVPRVVDNNLHSPVLGILIFQQIQ
jgi:hypothetical protein